MKKLILIPVLALVFVSCKDKSLTDSAYIEAGKQAAMVNQPGTQKVVVKKQPQRVVYTNTSSHNAQVAQKRGMSNSAKYAIVGGVGGAVIGGVATKSTKGAVIGGVVGAGTGYYLGRKRDKKTGRIQ